MSDQTFLTYAFSSAQERDRVAARLQSADFAVADAKRMGPSLNVRVRKGTGDQVEVELLLSQFAPEAQKLPSGSPTVNIVGYREGK